MQTVINISRTVYQFVKSGRMTEVDKEKIIEAFKNGVELSEHGRLIDADELPLDIDYADIENAPTLLEANKTGK